jgi:hypothetical protein
VFATFAFYTKYLKATIHLYKFFNQNYALYIKAIILLFIIEGTSRLAYCLATVLRQ